jgi:HSP20 family protein
MLQHNLYLHSNNEEKYMTVTNWNPWTELETFERALHRVFDLPLSHLFGIGQHEPWQPRTDVYETDVAYVVEADLPGVTMQDISVQLAETTLVIAGKLESALSGSPETHARVERQCGTFRRTFTLPTAVKSDEVQATYDSGVLTVTVPKADAARPRQITIQAA